MAIYVKWDCRGITGGNEELRESMARLSVLAEELRGIHRQLDPQLAEYDGIGRTLRAHSEGAEEEARRLRNESKTLDSVISVYTAAERTTMRASETLPTGIAERNLIFEEWFGELLR